MKTVMAKYKVKTRDCQLIVGVRLSLKEKINVPKSEYFLPSVVSKLIESGEKRVKVMVAEDKWYGVTYKEDKDTVSAALNKMADEGLYEGI